MAEGILVRVHENNGVVRIIAAQAVASRKFWDKRAAKSESGAEKEAAIAHVLDYKKAQILRECSKIGRESKGNLEPFLPIGSKI